MRKTKYLIITLLLIILPLNFLFSSTGQVKLKLRNIEVRRKNSDDYKKLNLTERVRTGDTVRSGVNSFAQIHFEAGGLLRILPESTVTFKEITRKKIVVHVEGGNVLAKFSGDAGEQIFKIETDVSRISFESAIVKVFHENNTTTIICVKGSLKVTSNMPEWKHLNPLKIGTTDKIVLSNLINQTNAPLLTATQEELFVDNEVFRQVRGVEEEDVRLEDFRRQAEQARERVERPQESGFNIHGAFGGVQLHRNGYFSLVARPEFYYRDFKIALYLPLYLDGVNRPYYSSYWGNVGEWNFKSTKDALGDLLVKIDYIKFGKKGTEYYLNIGSLRRFTFGNGFIVKNMNNMESFPIKRRTGFYFETDWKYAGMEIFIFDLNVADIQGYRMFFRPFAKMKSFMKKFEIGIIASFDTNPTGTRKNPAVFTIGVDIKIPLMKSKKIKLFFLFDWIKNGYRYKDSSLEGVSVLLDKTNSGGLSFIKGNGFNFTFEINYNDFIIGRLGYILSHRGTMPELMDIFYMPTRNEKITNMLDPARQNTSHGFQAEIEIRIKNILFIKAKYLLVKAIITGSSNEVDDKLHFSIGLVKGALWKLHFQFNYDRWNISGSFFNNFWKKAIMTLELGVIWTDNISIIGVARRFYTSANVELRTFMLETRITF